MAARFPKDPRELEKYPKALGLPVVHKVPHVYDTREEAQAAIGHINDMA